MAKNNRAAELIFCCVSLRLTLYINTVTSLAPSSGTISNISLVGMPGGAPRQTLPAQYVRTFGRWSLTTTTKKTTPDTTAAVVDDVQIDDSTTGGVQLSSQHQYHDFVVEPLPGSTFIPDSSSSSSSSFVDPTSTRELWWPSDISQLQIRPALDVLLNSGSPAYASAGLDVRVPPSASADNRSWFNYGLNSRPVARQWIAFARTVESNFRVEVFISRERQRQQSSEESSSNRIGENAHENESEDGEDGSAAPIKTQPQWERTGTSDLGALNETPSAHALFSSRRTKDALERIGLCVSSMDDTSPLSRGFHIVSVPLQDEWTDLPLGTTPSSTDRMRDTEGRKVEYKLKCIATSESNTEELLNLNDDDVGMMETGVLEVNVVRTAPEQEKDRVDCSMRTLFFHPKLDFSTKET